MSRRVFDENWAITRTFSRFMVSSGRLGPSSKRVKYSNRSRRPPIRRFKASKNLQVINLELPIGTKKLPIEGFELLVEDL